ncbi:E3 SUMO-protein ligase RanBP2 isoform X2 [Pleuronectes platessa]|uniref:E3 SUMO-protein ligase RanBP2 isoform X2 n=1 Tax=Pleuronectes platessa TaxID=8262 RepID=UPI00232A28D8|nr:E3 SUMO-protein ligase RanBP2 isoform X2 [Pleuronectes platessa]
MAQQENQLDRERFSCSICLYRLKDPVTTVCGHSYCMSCINTHWDKEERGSYSCPQCKQTFTPRPVLGKNTMLADSLEELKETGLLAAPADHFYAGPEDVACDVCTGRRLKAHKSCLVCLASYCEKHLQPHLQSAPLKKHKLVEPSKKLQENICSRHDEVMKMFCRTDQQCICYLCSVDEHKGHDTVTAAAERCERQRELGLRRQTIQQRVQDTEKDVKLLQQEEEAVKGSADKAVEDSEEIFTELIHLLEKRSSDVKQQIRSQQETEVSRVRELQEKLEQEITELKRKDHELKQLSDTEDNNQFLHNYPSVSFSKSTHSPSIRIRPLRNFEEVTAAVSQVRGRLQDILSETGAEILQIVSQMNVLQPQPEPETRADFFKYSQEIALDPNTDAQLNTGAEAPSSYAVYPEEETPAPSSSNSHSASNTSTPQELTPEQPLETCSQAPSSTISSSSSSSIFPIDPTTKKSSEPESNTEATAPATSTTTGQDTSFAWAITAATVLGNAMPSAPKSSSKNMDIHFERIVSLPEVETRTGEEDEEILFKERAKLYRFDRDLSQWKERGVGDLKILFHPSKHFYRILMRQEQVLRVCANHNITEAMELKPMPVSANALTWTATDYSDGHGEVEQLAAKFITAKIAESFEKTFRKCQNQIDQSGGDDSSVLSPQMSRIQEHSRDSNPQVFLKVSANDQTLGTITIELFSHIVSKTAENFKVLCTGGRGFGLRNSVFHRVIPGFMCQGGDITKGDGTGGKSIYGSKFEDENFDVRHTGPGIVSMANRGRHTNNSQFFITLKKAEHLDFTHVVFGWVRDGMDVVQQMGELGTKGGVPTKKLVITDCGQL